MPLMYSPSWSFHHWKTTGFSLLCGLFSGNFWTRLRSIDFRSRKFQAHCPGVVSTKLRWVDPREIPLKLFVLVFTPPRKLRYPTWGRGKLSSKSALVWGSVGSLKTTSLDTIFDCNQSHHRTFYEFIAWLVWNVPFRRSDHQGYYWVHFLWGIPINLHLWSLLGWGSIPIAVYSIIIYKNYSLLKSFNYLTSLEDVAIYINLDGRISAISPLDHLDTLKTVCFRSSRSRQRWRQVVTVEHTTWGVKLRSVDSCQGTCPTDQSEVLIPKDLSTFATLPENIESKNSDFWPFSILFSGSLSWFALPTSKSNPDHGVMIFQ